MEEQINVVVENEGKISFANEVLATIAGIAVCEVSGVAGMSGNSKMGIAGFAGIKNPSKLVQVSVSENMVTVDARVTVYYGACISDICANIQQNVSKNFEIMTGLRVKAVNILVEGLSFKDEKQEV